MQHLLKLHVTISSGVVLYKTLMACKTLYDNQSGQITYQQVLDIANSNLSQEPLATLQYINLNDFQDLSPMNRVNNNQPSLLSGAIGIGKTRLIDNIILGDASLHPFLHFDWTQSK